MDFRTAFHAFRKEWRLDRNLSGIVSRIILLMLVMQIVASNVEAQVSVTAIWKDGQSLPTTKEVICRHDNLKEEGIYKGMTLKPFDQLTSPSGLVYIELTAPNGSIFKGAGTLAIMLLPSQGKDILINVFSGYGEMQSSTGGVMTSGEVSIVVVKTEYSVRVRHTEAGPVREFLTLEGEVGIETYGPSRTVEGFPNEPPLTFTPIEKKSIRTGEKFVLANDGSITTTKINAEDIAQSATVYARLDTAKAALKKEINQAETFQNLFKRYTSVFEDPTNGDKRFELAVDQVNLEVSDDAIYQLKKAEQFTPEPNKTKRAVIAVTKAVAFKQAGNPQAAQTEMQKARALDPSVFQEGNLRTYRFNEKAREQVLKFQFIAIPPGQDPGTGRAWPLPSKMTSSQQRVFTLIAQGNFPAAYQASEALVQPLPRLTSIDAYGFAIIFYERKDPVTANHFAAIALKLSLSDRLLPNEAHDAAQRILQLTKQQ